MIGNNSLIVYAEGIPLQNQGLHEKIIRSVSPEFECIDKIYEANVVGGRIQDTIGDFDELIRRLKDEPEIVILGVDREAQDTYDLLMAHGIDICCFAEPKESNRKLLGKQVMSIEDAMRCLERSVFLNYKDIHGALGEEWTEYFDYYGFRRNKQYFLVKDYTDIPTSNLVHVLHGKNVLLTGDLVLCQLLSAYLQLVEKGEVKIQYIPLSDKLPLKKDDILCLVVPDYSARAEVIKKNSILRQKLLERGFTDYFACTRCFVLIDLYLNKNTEKYTIQELLPKGITIGRIPGHSGNDFFRGILDGHPEILIIPYSEFNNNLFFYCIRLANVVSNEVLRSFWEMYDAEMGNKKVTFPYLEIFEDTVKKLLGLKERFTSQELFVLFYIAYAEMLDGGRMSNISNLVIYWEPHFLSRNEFLF